ncbi:MAG TPA: CDP-alcohol phosphatidyltransferase family protein [Chitinophagales bacterium]|nr:CDP-alcohol phosphatidyltransferase family protein [Chitinophagales bacterium]
MSVLSLFNIANMLTLINLFSGCMAVVFLFNYRIELVPYCVLVSLVADFLDGFAARLTKNPTNIGLQLDSLADVVSFGVVPGAIIFQLLFQKFESSEAMISTNRLYLYSAPAFLITLFAALRLAKFNVDTRQTTGFIGLATPAATLFVVGLLLMFLNNSFGLAGLIYTGKVLYGTALVLPVLMISEIPMFGFKFKSYGWKGNEVRYLFIILSVVLMATLKFAAVPLIVILYVIVSIIQKLINK